MREPEWIVPSSFGRIPSRSSLTSTWIPPDVFVPARTTLADSARRLALAGGRTTDPRAHFHQLQRPHQFPHGLTAQVRIGAQDIQAGNILGPKRSEVRFLRTGPRVLMLLPNHRVGRHVTEDLGCHLRSLVNRSCRELRSLH